MLARVGMMDLTEAGLSTSGEAGGAGRAVLLSPAPLSLFPLLAAPGVVVGAVWRSVGCCSVLEGGVCSSTRAEDAGLPVFLVPLPLACFPLVILPRSLVRLLSLPPAALSGAAAERGEMFDELRLSGRLGDDEEGERPSGVALADEGGDER